MVADLLHKATMTEGPLAIARGGTPVIGPKGANLLVAAACNERLLRVGSSHSLMQMTGPLIGTLRLTVIFPIAQLRGRGPGRSSTTTARMRLLVSITSRN